MTPTPAPPRPLPAREALALTRRAVREAVRADVPGTRRGVALLVVLVTVAVMGALSTEFSYTTRTNIWMSGNVTAETQALYHARSALEIATLAVNAKKNFPMMKQALTMMGGQGGQRLEVWRQACEFVNIFSTGKAAFFGFDVLDMTEEEAVGVSKGAFTCAVSAEDSRTNLNAAATDSVQALDARQRLTGTPQLRPGALPGGVGDRQLADKRKQLGLKLYGLFRPLLDSGQFDREEDMVELILNIMDWTDADENKTDIGPSGEPMESSAAEGADYGRYGYEAKNARMDSVGEVQLVSGMTSDVYCRIRDKLTVFSTGKLNVNDADLATLKGVACQAIDDEIQRNLMCWNILPGQIAPVDQALLVMDTCRELKKAAFSTPFTSIAQFTRFFQTWAGQSGVALALNQSTINENLGVTSSMVRIEATGEYRGTTRKISTVIDLNSGSAVHYRVD